LCGLHARQGFGSGDDRDALMHMQVERVFIAGDDETGFGGECTGEHEIIVGIAHDAGDLDRLDQLDDFEVIGAPDRRVLHGCGAGECFSSPRLQTGCSM